VIAAGLRRLLVILGSLGALTVVASSIVAVVSATSLARSVSVGLMFMGAFLFVGGAAVGLRGPVRHTRRVDGSVDGMTFASPVERIETIGVSYVLVAVGILFVLVGVVIAPNVRLV
jgi:hypothetical protein